MRLLLLFKRAEAWYDKSMQKNFSLKVMVGFLVIIVLGSMVFAWEGVILHERAHKQEARFRTLQQEYFSVPLAEREAAPVGSSLHKKRVAIEQYPAFLEHVQLLGIGKFLTALYFLLFAVLMMLLLAPVRIMQLMETRRQKDGREKEMEKEE